MKGDLRYRIKNGDGERLSLITMAQGPRTDESDAQLLAKHMNKPEAKGATIERSDDGGIHWAPLESMQAAMLTIYMRKRAERGQ